MRRIGWLGTTAALVWGLTGCGEAASTGTPAGCGNCHSAPGEGPPFHDHTGSTDTSRLAVGAHDGHLLGTGITGISSAPVACDECHTVPRTLSDPGHVIDSPGDIRFGPLARTGGASPEYLPQGCAATYCHGNFPGGNPANTPQWLGETTPLPCSSCHGFPPPTGCHAFHATFPCATCHDQIVAATHVNGATEVPLRAWNPADRTCAFVCHVERPWGI